MTKLAGRFLHLLPQKIKRGEFFRALVLNVEIDIIANRVRWPKSVNAASGQQILRGDLIDKFSRVIKKLTCLFANHRIVQDCRITAAQLPDVKERRPIDVGSKL